MVQNRNVEATAVDDSFASPTKTWVLWWSYYDHSGFEVCRVYLDESRANEDFDLVRDLNDSRRWMLTETFIYGDGGAKQPSTLSLSDATSEPTNPIHTENQ